MENCLNNENNTNTFFSYTNLIEEFFILGIESYDHAKNFYRQNNYKGECLLSIPSGWGKKEKIIDKIFTHDFKLPDKNLPPYSYSMSFNETIYNINYNYYIHCYVVHENITKLMKQAESYNSIDKNLIDMSESKRFKQKNYFYPFHFCFKTKGIYHNSFKKLLEILCSSLYKLSKTDEIMKKLIDENNNEKINLYQMIKFTSNLFFLLNNFIRPGPGTKYIFKTDDSRICFHEISTIKHPYHKELGILSIFEFNVDFVFDVWKNVLIGYNVIIISDSLFKRFDLIEAISIFVFPFHSIIKFTNFPYKDYYEFYKKIGNKKKNFFIGVNNNQSIEDLFTLFNEPYNIFNIDDYTCNIKSSFALEKKEIELKEKFCEEKNNYFKELNELLFKNNDYNFLEKLKRKTVKNITNLFLNYIKNDFSVSKSKSRRLSIKKKDFKDYGLIISPESIISPLHLSNLLFDLGNHDLSDSSRFKNLIFKQEGKKREIKLNKKKIILIFELKPNVIFYFAKKIFYEGNSWNRKDLKKFEEIFEQDIENEKKEEELTNNFSSSFILDFIRSFFDKNSDQIKDDLLYDVKKLNFDIIIKKDFENIEFNKSGSILNIIKFNYNKSLFYSNKAIFYFAMRNLFIFHKQAILIKSNEILNSLLKAYFCFINSEKDQNEKSRNFNLDCYDFPKNLLSFLLNDKNEETKLQNKDLKFFKENIIKINNMSQKFNNFCDYFSNFLNTNILQDKEFLEIDLTNNNNNKIKSFYEYFQNTDFSDFIFKVNETFKKLEKRNEDFENNEDDDDKLMFFINFFNIKLIYELIFTQIREKKSFPQSLFDWTKFLIHCNFTLLGHPDLSLAILDVSIIRQHLFLKNEQFYIQKMQFQITGSTDLYKIPNFDKEKFPFFIRKNKRKDEVLINFALSLCLKDTPNFRIFKNLNEDLKANTKDYFKKIRKNYPNNSFTHIPFLPEEIEEIFLKKFPKDKVSIFNFLNNYYYEEPIQKKEITFNKFKIRWTYFHISKSEKN